MNPKIKYFNSLDGLRAIAAIGVIIAHYFNVDNVGNYKFILKIAPLGNSGVSLFFVLSGFVITRILLNSIDSKYYFKTFYFRRTLRIFPLYYFSLACYYIIPYLLNLKSYIPDFSSQLPYWLYYQNFSRTFMWGSDGPGHFWSLAVEEHFYLIWPALIYIIYRNRNLNNLLKVSVLLIIIPFILRYYMLTKGLEINVFTFTRLDQLALGGVLAIIEAKGLLTKKNFKYFLTSFFIGIIFIGITNKMDYFNLNLYKHYAFGICYFGLIGISAIGSNKMLLNKFLRTKPMQYLGRISYGLYVWHIIIIEIVNHYFLTRIMILDFIIVVSLTVILSALSFKYLEKPFLVFKKHFNY